MQGIQHALQPSPVLVPTSPGLLQEHEGAGGSHGGCQGSQLSVDTGAGCSQPKGTLVCCGVPWLAKHLAPRDGVAGAARLQLVPVGQKRKTEG